MATNDGEVYVRSGIKNLNDQVFYANLSKEWIEILKFSPNGKLLAVGSHDNNIYILDSDNGYNTKCVLRAH